MQHHQLLPTVYFINLCECDRDNRPPINRYGVEKQIVLAFLSEPTKGSDILTVMGGLTAIAPTPRNSVFSRSQQ
uniref:Uncharacterized protein n=1 Tax=Desertifilum tharense IPPAS B-1220 TaxID=1781255 RepID=A0ACD5GXM4_9CYAN